MLTLYRKPRNIERFMDDFFNDTIFSEVKLDSFSPKVNISENENQVLIEAELPGLEKKDINITIEKGIMKISGEKKYESKDTKYYTKEIKFGKFERQISLDESQLDIDKINAEMKNGILELTIPKKEKVKPKLIEIK